MITQKQFYHFILLLSFVVISNARIRILTTSPECSNHGYLYKNTCFCQSQWTGMVCSQQTTHKWHNTADKCDDLTNRLDHLVNISPDFYENDDDEFPRLKGDSIGSGQASYGSKGNGWTKMHYISNNFTIFGDSIRPRDIKQGSLGNCYLLAAFASLANIRDGELIKDAFVTKKDNNKHVYVTRWLIDGKPRFVAVDDWIPGNGNYPAFSKIAGDHDFWGIILEKAWAKIHGTYMITQGGWHTAVWEALTQAQTRNLHHSSTDANKLFETIKDLLAKEYPIGSATVANKEKNLVQSHAYSVLNAFDISLDNGQRQKLIFCFNPWNTETWKNNPWAEGSVKWTQKVKSQVKGYSEVNDGAFYMTPEDYHKNFGITNWAEVQKDYFVSFKDISLQSGTHSYKTTFKYTGSKQPIYVKIDITNARLIRGCVAPFQVNSLQIKDPNGNIHQGNNKEINNAPSGTYELTANIIRNKDYHKYFSFTVYAPKGKVLFEGKNKIEKKENQEKEEKKSCPNNCNNQGKCDTDNGTCLCNTGFMGNDCSKKQKLNDNCIDKNQHCTYWATMYCIGIYQPYMKGNCALSCFKKGFPYCWYEDQEDKCSKVHCGQGGTCDKETGKCVCKKGYIGDNCSPCIDETNKCSKFVNLGYCKSTSFAHPIMKEICMKSCGAKGEAGFGNCIL